MLKELNIKNFAVIDELRVEFTPGLNVFTGETGAGKSIIIDALNLILGERASADVIRTGCSEAVVEAAFELGGLPGDAVRALLAEQGIGMENGVDLIVRRLVSSSGKNKIYLNGGLANVSALTALGEHLADIHGQHQHQSLLSPDRQLDMLDAFGGTEPAREAFAVLYRSYRKTARELHELASGERNRAQREDMLRFQKNEIESAMLKPGEDEELVREQKVLANSEKIAALARAADDALYASDHAVLTELKKAVTGIREIAAIDARLAPALELCETAKNQIEEAAREVSSYAEQAEFDPDRLEQIGDRLDLIRKLKKKYGQTIDEVLAFGAGASAELERMERSTDEIARLKSDLQSLRETLTTKADALTKARAKAAGSLEKKIEAELAHLGMKRTTFQVALSGESGEDTLNGRKTTPRGADRVEFLISPNPGEEPKSLARIASGGELSRVMLALKTILAANDSVPTLVFDEVDAGIGGAVAEEVGKKLKKVASKRQVFCVTHLAQIASMAASHYGVAKTVADNRTSTEVRLLGKQERVREIARMLGGKTITDATVKHAEEMIERGAAL